MICKDHKRVFGIEEVLTLFFESEYEDRKSVV